MPENNQNRTQKTKFTKIILPIILTLSIILSFVGGFFVRELIAGSSAINTSNIVSLIEKFGYIIDPVTGEKREFTESDYAKAITDALLDDYSVYYSPEEYREVTENRGGNYKGYGITFSYEDCTIYRIMGNSPAFSAGLKEGDEILGAVIGEKDVLFNSGQELAEYFESNPDKITLIIKGEGQSESKKVSVESKNYLTSYVTYYDNQGAFFFVENADRVLEEKTSSQMKMSELTEDIAYIKLSHFEGGAFNQLKKALSYMNERGRTKLILDVRANGGGYMDILTDIASLFIENEGKGGAVVALAESNSGREIFTTGANNFDKNVENLVVLADGNSASATECLIGALISHKVIGYENVVIEKNSKGVAKTFGKGIMQTTYMLTNGGAFKITTAKVLWPDEKTCIHGKGIVVTGENAVDKGIAVLRAVQLLSQ